MATTLTLKQIATKFCDADNRSSDTEIVYQQLRSLYQRGLLAALDRGAPGGAGRFDLEQAARAVLLLELSDIGFRGKDLSDIDMQLVVNSAHTVVADGSIIRYNVAGAVAASLKSDRADWVLFLTKARKPFDGERVVTATIKPRQLLGSPVGPGVSVDIRVRSFTAISVSRILRAVLLDA